MNFNAPQAKIDEWKFLSRRSPLYIYTSTLCARPARSERSNLRTLVFYILHFLTLARHGRQSIPPAPHRVKGRSYRRQFCALKARHRPRVFKLSRAHTLHKLELCRNFKWRKKLIFLFKKKWLSFQIYSDACNNSFFYTFQPIFPSAIVAAAKKERIISSGQRGEEALIGTTCHLTILDFYLSSKWSRRGGQEVRKRCPQGDHVLSCRAKRI